MKGNRVVLGGMLLLTLAGLVRSQTPNGSLPVAIGRQNGAGSANAIMPGVQGQTVAAPVLASCGSCEQAECGFIDAGASFFLLKPYLQSNTAFTVSTGSTAVTAGNTATTGLATS